MRGLIVLSLVLFAAIVVWRVFMTQPEREAVKSALRRHLWVLVLIVALVFGLAYLSWVFALNVPAVKFL